MPTHRARHRPSRGGSDEILASLIARLGAAPAPGDGGPRHAAALVARATPTVQVGGPWAVPAVPLDLWMARVRRAGPRPVFAAVSVAVLGATAAVTAASGPPLPAAAMQLVAASMAGPVAPPSPEPDIPDTVRIADLVSDATAAAPTTGAQPPPTPAARAAVKAPTRAAGTRATPRPVAAAHATPAPAPKATAGSSTGARALAAALTKVGKPYVWGAAGPNSFDCSGLVLWAFAQQGVSLPHSSKAQSTMGAAVSRDQLQPGDLVFFYSPVSHVGIYAGDGKILAASRSGQPVKLASMAHMSFHNARRL